MVLATITGLFTLLAVGYYSKKILKDFSNQYKPLLEHRFSMELANLSEVDPEEKTEIDQVLPQQLHTQDSSPVSLAIVDLEKPHKTETLTGDSLENQKLVSLLKPDSQQRMPHFKPYSNPTDDSVKQPVQTTLSEIELTESIPDNTEKSFPTFSENPLLRPHLHEQQLDLYSLEHQTELSLKAADAAYLLFIDCSSNRAPIENPEEHNHLLTQYRRLINLVINIYGGNLELLASGDIRVMFDDQDINDNHGVQALCAAKLFNQLYKYYNHRQITRMQPTLNIQLSLVRGNRAKIELLREEAHFLTCTTVSNELISHTPLSEVQALKETLLDNAQTERQDEDKILILSLNASYQELLERQARHLAKTI
jgi:hypothetical protein